FGSRSGGSPTEAILIPVSERDTRIVVEPHNATRNRSESLEPIKRSIKPDFPIVRESNSSDTARRFMPHRVAKRPIQISLRGQTHESPGQIEMITHPINR